MRFIVLGAGAIGGTVGARIFQLGYAVTLLARGAHYEAIRDHGLRLDSPGGTLRVRPQAVGRVADIRWQPEDVALLATKSQDTADLLTQLESLAPADLPIVCLQNGVANEGTALRRFPNVYGVFVWCPSEHLEPGVVESWSTSAGGILDVGRYPSGSDRVAERLAAVFREATFYSEARADIMRWKYRKLLMNLGNAVEALCGDDARHSSVVERARREGVECLNAAGIPFVQEEEDAVRREHALRLGTIEGRKRSGGSTWQSLQKRSGSVETDYLNGEIVLLGRLYGVPTPVNARLQRLSQQAASERRPPGSLTAAQLEALVGTE
jgi:2-dehydropantoate 2-reductase